LDSKAKATSMGLEDCDFLTLDVRIRPVVVPAKYFKNEFPPKDVIMYRVYTRTSTQNEKEPLEYESVYYEDLISAVASLAHISDKLQDAIAERIVSSRTIDSTTNNEATADDSDTLYQMD